MQDRRGGSANTADSEQEIQDFPLGDCIHVLPSSCPCVWLGVREVKKKAQLMRLDVVAEEEFRKPRLTKRNWKAMISVMVPRGAPSRCVNYIAEDFFFLSYDCAIFLLKNDVRFTFAVWFEFKI